MMLSVGQFASPAGMTIYLSLFGASLRQSSLRPLRHRSAKSQLAIARRGRYCMAMAPAKRSLEPTSTHILTACREVAGKDASAEACAVVLAAAAGIALSTAKKALKGIEVRQGIARKISEAIEDWGHIIPAGDIAMGDD